MPTQDDGFPVLRLTAMESGRINFAEAKGGAWTRDDAASWLVESGDFFVMPGNGSIDRVGSAAIAGGPAREVAFPDTMIRLRASRSVVEPHYLLAAWSSRPLRAQSEASARTTAGIHKVNQSSISRYVVPVPHPGEQRRIATEVDRRLSVLDAISQNFDANLARFARLRQSILKRAFEGRLVSAAETAEQPAPVADVS